MNQYLVIIKTIPIWSIQDGPPPTYKLVYKHYNPHELVCYIYHKLYFKGNLAIS